MRRWTQSSAPAWVTNRYLQCKSIISKAVTKVQQIQKKSFPYIWNFSPKTNLPELKDLEKFTTAELKRFINLQILKLLQMLSIWKWKWQASIGEKKEFILFLQTSQDFTTTTYFLSKKSFSEHLTLLLIFVFWFLCSTKEKNTRFHKMKKYVSNILIIHLHKLFIYLVILVIIPKFLVCVLPDNRGAICLCILFPQFYL